MRSEVSYVDDHHRRDEAIESIDDAPSRHPTFWIRIVAGLSALLLASIAVIYGSLDRRIAALEGDRLAAHEADAKIANEVAIIRTKQELVMEQLRANGAILQEIQQEHRDGTALTPDTRDQIELLMRRLTSVERMLQRQQKEGRDDR